MGHVTFDEVTSCQSCHQRELPRQDGGTNHTGQLASVLARLVGAVDAEYLQTTNSLNVEERTKRTPARLQRSGSRVELWRQLHVCVVNFITQINQNIILIDLCDKVYDLF